MQLLNIARAWRRPIAQWPVVGIHAPQNVVVAEFATATGLRQVTFDHSVAALDPLTIAIGGGADDAGGRLIFRDVATGAMLGWLALRYAGAIDDIGLFHVSAGDHRCVAWPLRPWNRRLQARAQQRQRVKPTSFTMSPAATEQLMIAYIAPRPVVLVSVMGPRHSNLFPMDLIGPIGGDRFALALRRTSASIATMIEQGRVALSDPAASLKHIVYRLGAHHSTAMIDWTTLPFATTGSEYFGLPAMADALRIRELAIEQSHAIGSHQFFIGRIVSEHRGTSAAQMHHTAGFHQYYRKRRGVELML